MNRLIAHILSISLLLLPGTLWAKSLDISENKARDISIEFLEPFFMALKSGDIEAIKMYMSDNMYKKYEVLLEKNKAYPKFLQKIYQNARFSITDINIVDDQIDVMIRVEYKDGKVSYHNLSLLQPYTGFDFDEPWVLEYLDIEPLTLPDGVSDPKVWKVKQKMAH